MRELTLVCINIHNIGESVLGSVTNYKRRFKKDVISRSKYRRVIRCEGKGSTRQ